MTPSPPRPFPTPASSNHKGLRSRTLRSLGALGFRQTFQRTVSFAVTLLLYRLLTARDFGIFSLCEIAVSWAILCQDFGIQDTLIQRKKENNFADVLYTAWRLRMILAGACLMGLLAGAGTIADFFQRSEIAFPLRLFSLLLLIQLGSFPMEVHLQKNVRFEKFIVPDVAAQLVSAAVSVGLAFAGRGYWALVMAGLMGPLARYLVLRYTTSFQCPPGKWEAALIPGLMKGSFLLFGAGMLSFFLTQSTHVLVAKHFSMTSVGLFYLAFNWANFAVTSVIQFSGKVLFPAVSEIEENLPRVRKAYDEFLHRTAFVAAPFNAGLAVLAPSAIPFLVGSKWQAAIPLCQILCLYGYLRALTSPNYTVLQSLGLFKKISFCRIAELGIFLTLFLPFAKAGGLPAVAWLLVLSKGIGWLFSLGNVTSAIRGKNGKTAVLLIPSAVSALIMGASLCALRAGMTGLPVPIFLQLLCEILIGLLVYLMVYIWAAPKGGQEIRSMLSDGAAILRGGHT